MSQKNRNKSTSKQSDETSENQTVDNETNEGLLKRNVKELFHRQPGRQLDALTSLKAMLSSRDLNAFETVGKFRVALRCAQLMREEQNPELQLEAAWVLCYITTGNVEQIQVAVDAGAVEGFIHLLKLNQTLAKIALRALGNIVELDPTVRNLVISKGIIPPLVDLVTPESPRPILETTAGILFKLCARVEPYPPEQSIILCLPAVVIIMKLSKNMDVVCKACSCLSVLGSLSEAAREKTAKEMCESGLVQRLVELLDYGKMEVLAPCFAAMVQLVSSSESRAQHLIDAGALVSLVKLLKSVDDEVVRYAAWTVRNIVAKCTLHASHIVEADLLTVLTNMEDADEIFVQENVCYSLVCITLKHEDALNQLGEINGAPAMFKLLKSTNVSTVLTTLTSIRDTLSAATELGKLEKLKLSIEKYGGLDLIKGLQNFENDEIHQLALEITDKFFPK